MGKVGRCASEDVVLKLICVKCVPILFYGVEACSLNVSDERSFDFVLIRTMMKVFRTSSIDIVNECQCMFGVSKASDTLVARKRLFLTRYSECENVICQCFAKIAIAEVFGLK